MGGQRKSPQHSFGREHGEGCFPEKEMVWEKEGGAGDIIPDVG